jgi:hypothetical protein
MSTGAAGGQTRSLSRIATAIRDLHPGYFAFVMATGIISTGTFLLGPSWLSRALLAAASIGLVVLSAARALAKGRRLTLLTATKQPEISEAAVLAELLRN